MFRARRDSAACENKTEIDSPKSISAPVPVPAVIPGTTSNSSELQDSFLLALLDAQTSAQAASSARSTVSPIDTAKRFNLTTAMGPYPSRLLFAGLTVSALLIVNGLLLAFSFSPITAAFLWSPLALLAICDAAIAVDANKMFVEIDNQQLAIRFQKRLPWPVRDQVYPLEQIRRLYLQSKRVRKLLFSSAHSNDTETSHFSGQHVE